MCGSVSLCLWVCFWERKFTFGVYQGGRVDSGIDLKAWRLPLLLLPFVVAQRGKSCPATLFRCDILHARNLHFLATKCTRLLPKLLGCMSSSSRGIPSSINLLPPFWTCESRLKRQMHVQRMELDDTCNHNLEEHNHFDEYIWVRERYSFIDTPSHVPNDDEPLEGRRQSQASPK